MYICLSSCIKSKFNFSPTGVKIQPGLGSGTSCRYTALLHHNTHTRRTDSNLPTRNLPPFHVIALVRKVFFFLYNGIQRPRLEFEVREITRIADDQICELVARGGWWHTGSQSGKRCFLYNVIYMPI